MYEYKIVYAMTTGGMEKELNKQAAQGWRAVTTFMTQGVVIERAKP